MLDRYTQANKELWNDWADIHVGSRFYDVKGFRAGACALRPLEVEELGDVTGKTLLHLQCHFGLDTLSWARRGARVTGIDLSDHAIDAARGLAAELGIDATFVCTPLYELEDVLEGEFDIAFTSYGAIEWLPDLDRWARIVARYLKPGGTFYMAEIDPFAQMLDETAPGNGDIAVAFPYFGGGEPVRDEVQGSYADPDAHVEHNVCYSWYQSYETVIAALLGAGLRIEYLHEFPFSVAPFWRTMFRDDDGWWYLPGPDGTGRREDLPFIYSIKATRPAGAAAAGAPQAAPSPAAAPGAIAPATKAPAIDTTGYSDSNREMWDELASIHETSPMYDVPGFLAGRDTLTDIERRELVPHVAGATLLHLQCHLGQDTLSLARAGARVTGVDFSGEAVATARRLAGEAGLEARFIQSDVLLLDAVLDERFDIVYTAWGVLLWLPDLTRWATQIRRALKPGGLFYIAEFHPAGYVLDDTSDSEILRPGYSYFHTDEPLCFDDDTDYADPKAKVAHTRSFEWTHTMGDIVSSLSGAGLEVEFLHEFPHTIGLSWPFLVTGPDGLKRVRGHEDTFPLSFSLLARG